MMTVKRRILAIKIIEKSKKYPEVLKKLGVRVRVKERTATNE